MIKIIGIREVGFLLAFLVSWVSEGQSIYKGLEYGMTKKEAVDAFRADRDTYINIDLGNGFKYRIYQQNFIYENDSLVGVTFNPKGTAMGMDYNSVVNYLNYTRSVFEDLGYSVFYESEHWNAPINYDETGSMWGLVMINPEKTNVVQMHPGINNLSSTSKYTVILRMWNRKKWIEFYNESKDTKEEKIEKSGF